MTDVDGLAAGSITNETGAPLRNARLLYGSWAYRLGNLRAGQRVDIGEELSPRRAKTIVTRDALGESGATAAQVEGRVFAADQASPLDILNLMMFYETAGGYGFAHLPNRYQAYCDMSRQLELGQAVLVAESRGGRARQLLTRQRANRLSTKARHESQHGISVYFAGTYGSGIAVIGRRTKLTR